MLTTKGSCLQHEAERIFCEWEAATKKLYRPDGKPRYAVEEHAERERDLRRRRDAELDRVLGVVAREIEECQRTLDAAESGDPTQLLNSAELQEAGAKKAFVDSDVGALSRKDLETRLRTVADSADPAALFCYREAARRRAKDLPPGLLGELTQKLASGSPRKYELNEARKRLADAEKARLDAQCRKRGARTVGGVYSRETYGHIWEELGVG